MSSLVITELEVARSAALIGLLPPEMTISSSSNVSWAIALIVKIEKMAADMHILILLIDKLPHKLSFLGSNGSKFKLALLLTDKS
jgi:hypothetical protein